MIEDNGILGCLLVTRPASLLVTGFSSFLYLFQGLVVVTCTKV